MRPLVTVARWLWVRFTCGGILVIYKELVSRYNRGVEFHHSVHNASKIRRNVGSTLQLGSLCILCIMRDTA